MAVIRGLASFGDTLYAVRDSSLLRIDSAGPTSTVGTLSSGGGAVDFSANLTQLVINDGTFIYGYTPSSNTFTTAAGYSGGDRICFLDQRVFFLIRGTQQFGWTGLGNLTISALDFASAERSPDALVSIASANGELWLFGSQSTEVWQPTGTSAVVQRQQAAGIEYGCAAAYTVQNLSNSIAWLGRDERGQAMVLKAAGYQPQRISTRAIEERFTGRDLTGSTAFVYSEGGQQFYLLNVPGVDTTLVWDDTFGEWHERAELAGAGYAQWRARNHAFAYGKHFFGADDGRMFFTDRATNTFAGDPKCRERISPVISPADRSGSNYAFLEVVCEKATTGTVLLRFSNDNGATWSQWRTASAGLIGEYARRVRFNRLGTAYDRVFQIRMTDDAAFNPVLVAIRTT